MSDGKVYIFYYKGPNSSGVSCIEKVQHAKGKKKGPGEKYLYLGQETCCLKQENSFVQKKRLVFERKLLSKTRKFFCVKETSCV